MPVDGHKYAGSAVGCRGPPSRNAIASGNSKSDGGRPKAAGSLLLPMVGSHDPFATERLKNDRPVLVGFFLWEGHVYGRSWFGLRGFLGFPSGGSQVNHRPARRL